MRPTDHLRGLAAEDWRAATTHPFCAALAAGSLPRARMIWYLEQDYQFIEGFVRLLASAVAQAPTLADALPLARFLGEVAGPENTYFQRSFEALGVSGRAETAPATQAFQRLMAEAAASGDYAQMLAVLVVAEWSYLSWASPLNPPAARPTTPTRCCPARSTRCWAPTTRSWSTATAMPWAMRP